MKDYGPESLTQTSAPAAEPVLVADQKTHMRITASTEDTLITSYLAAARSHIEKLTARRLITQTWRWTLDSFPAWDYLELPLAPVASVTSIKYTDQAGTQHTFSSSSYIVDATSRVARVVLKTGYAWPLPAASLREVAAVETLFVVGYGTAGTSVPPELLLAIKLLAAHFYENREVVAPVQLHELPMGIRALISPYILWERVL